jgi:hypothetical protein
MTAIAPDRLQSRHHRHTKVSRSTASPQPSPRQVRSCFSRFFMIPRGDRDGTEERLVGRGVLRRSKLLCLVRLAQASQNLDQFAMLRRGWIFQYRYRMSLGDTVIG